MREDRDLTQEAVGKPPASRRENTAIRKPGSSPGRKSSWLLWRNITIQHW